MNYRKRIAMTHPFEQSVEEKQLQNDVVDFMNREISFAFPQRQRQLIEMILFKTLASSPQALAGTLGTMRHRLIALRDNLPEASSPQVIDQLGEDTDIDLEDLLDDLDDDETTQDIAMPLIHGKLLAEELAELDKLIARAQSITSDSKSKALLTALNAAFMPA